MSGSAFLFSLEGPLTPPPLRHQLRAAHICGFHHLVKGFGGRSWSILEKHGVDSAALGDPDLYIDSLAVIDALEYCSRLFRDPLFGLHLAESQEIDIYGCVAALARAAPTLREGLQRFSDYLPVTHTTDGRLEVVEQGELAELRYCAPADFELSRQALYQSIVLNTKLLRCLAGRRVVPLAVDIAMALPPQEREAVERRLRCPLRSRSRENAAGDQIGYSIHFPRTLLGLMVPTSNRETYTILGAYLEQVKATGVVTTLEQVESYIRGSLASGVCNIARCARTLGVSVRTLQFRLADAGVSFKELVERRRLELAQAYLCRGDLGLTEIAARLGYADQSSFARAFKRWTGRPPLAYRAAVC